MGICLGAILPNDYSALSKPTFSSLAVASTAIDEEAQQPPPEGGGGGGDADPLKESIQAFLRQMEAGKKSGRSSEDGDDDDEMDPEEEARFLRTRKIRQRDENNDDAKDLDRPDPTEG